MSQTTIHGWPVLAASDPALRLFGIPGCKGRSMRLRKDVGPYLVAFASEYHALVEPLTGGTFDDWSWSPLRDGRASNDPSDHCAGVAIDLNAVGSGRQGIRLTWWLAHPVKYARLRRLLKKYRLLEWGGDYQKFVDPMHFTFKFGVKAGEIRMQMKALGIDSDGRIGKVA